MGKIQVLDKNIAELIAAGEVVERPSSVIKELVENSIDAGATSITVEIKNGGIKLMKITDNGCGIEKSDLPVAFLRHATSKVKTKDDIYNIGTLGFRGEALASISAVSKVELITRTQNDEVANRITVEGGEIGEPMEYAGAYGTMLSIRDLFYNIPARMKFLKKDVTEGNAIATLIDRLALSHPEISFRFIREGQKKLHTSGDGNLLSAIYSVYGREIGQNMLEVKYSSNGISVYGYIGKPEAAKASRNMEHFFINGRYVRCMTAAAALEEGFKTRVMVGRYPICVLNITMPNDMIDVNVHPAKLEVKLTNERAIFHSVYSAVYDALMNLNQAVSFTETAGEKVKTKLNYFNLKNREDLGEQQTLTAQKYNELIKPQNKENIALSSSPVKELYQKQLFDKEIKQEEYKTNRAEFNLDTKPIKSVDDISQKKDETVYSEPIIFIPPKRVAKIDNDNEKLTDTVFNINRPSEEDKKQNPEPPKERYEYIGEVFNTYIIAKCEQSLLLIDKHAAHERLLYEQIKSSYYENGLSTQMLLLPQIIAYSKDVYDVIINNHELFMKLGFSVGDFGDGNVIVHEIPSVYGMDNVEDTITEIAEKLLVGGETQLADKIDDLFHTMACKAAVKGGQYNNIDEQKKLLSDLSENPNVRHCPHGRPIIIELTRRDIEKMFGRLGSI